MSLHSLDAGTDDLLQQAIHAFPYEDAQAVVLRDAVMHTLVDKPEGIEPLALRQMFKSKEFEHLLIDPITVPVLRSLATSTPGLTLDSSKRISIDHVQLSGYRRILEGQVDVLEKVLALFQANPVLGHLEDDMQVRAADLLTACALLGRAATAEVILSLSSATNQQLPLSSAQVRHIRMARDYEYVHKEKEGVYALDVQLFGEFLQTVIEGNRALINRLLPLSVAEEKVSVDVMQVAQEVSEVESEKIVTDTMPIAATMLEKLPDPRDSKWSDDFERISAARSKSYQPKSGAIANLRLSRATASEQVLNTYKERVEKNLPLTDDSNAEVDQSIDEVITEVSVDMPAANNHESISVPFENNLKIEVESHQSPKNGTATHAHKNGFNTLERWVKPKSVRRKRDDNYIDEAYVGPRIDITESDGTIPANTFDLAAENENYITISARRFQDKEESAGNIISLEEAKDRIKQRLKTAEATNVVAVSVGSTSVVEGELFADYSDKPLVQVEPRTINGAPLPQRAQSAFGIMNHSPTHGCRNVQEAILRYGHDEDYIPDSSSHHFVPTDAPAGSPEKIEILRRRVEMGFPLWHDKDRVDYSGLTGAIKPRADLD